MNELTKLIGIVLGAVLLIGSISFSLGLIDAVARISQGDPSASQEVTKLIEDEVVNTVNWEVVRVVVIAFASALGLGSLTALFRKL